MKRSILVLLIVSLVVITLLSGCKSTGPTVSPTESPTVAPQNTPDTEKPSDGVIFPLEEPLEITLSVDANAIESNYFMDYIFEKTNIRIKQEANDATKLKLLLASDNPPDMIHEWNGLSVDGTFVEFGREGVLADIMKYIDKMPNLAKKFERYPRLRDEFLDNGSLYFFKEFHTNDGIPYVRATYHFTFNGNVLSELNSSVPETWDEFLDLCAAFKEIYPDEYPMAGGWGGYFSSLMRSAIAGKSDYMGFDMDKQEFYFIANTEEFKEALQCMNDLYANGYINPEIFTWDYSTWNEQFDKGTFLCDFYYNAYSGIWGRDQTLLSVGMTLPSGRKMKIRHNDCLMGWGSAAICNTENVEVCMALADYFMSEEVKNVYWYGIEGENYTKDANEVITIINPIKFDNGFRCWMGVNETATAILPALATNPYNWRNDILGSELLRQQLVRNYDLDWSDFVLAENPSLNLTTEQREEVNLTWTPIKTEIDMAVNKFMTGEWNLTTDWDAFVNSLGDYQKIVDMYNQSFKEKYTDKGIIFNMDYVGSVLDSPDWSGYSPLYP